MKIIKNGIISSLIITAPVFFIIPILLYIVSYLINIVIENENVAIFGRIIVLIVIYYYVIKIYRSGILKKYKEKYKIDEKGENVFTMMLYGGIIPAFTIGNFYAAYKYYFIPKIALMFNVDLDMNLDFLTRIEMVFPLAISFSLLGVWWPDSNSRDSGGGGGG